MKTIINKELQMSNEFFRKREVLPENLIFEIGNEKEESGNEHTRSRIDKRTLFETRRNQ
jgi:hypothetical protein